MKTLWQKFCASMKESWEDAKPGYIVLGVLVVALAVNWVLIPPVPTAQAQTLHQKNAFTQLLQAQYVHAAIESHSYCATNALSNVNVVFALMQNDPKISNSKLRQLNLLLAGGYERQLSLLQKIETGIRQGKYSSFTEVQYNFLMMCEVNLEP